MSRSLKFDYKEGTKIYFELHNGHQYEGIFIESDNFRIKISDLIQLPGKSKLSGHTLFFRKEILIIKEIENANTSDAEVDTEIVGNATADSFKYWTEKIKTWSYIAVLNSDYDECIKKLNCCDTIAINGFGSKVHLLAVATKFDLYVIDIEQCPTAFDFGLRCILQSRDICKVVFNSALLANLLYHLYQVRLCNFFDIQIADKFISKKDALCKLSDLLVEYVQIKEESAQVVDNLPVDATIDKTILKNCILSVVYMIPLKCTFENMMLKSFYAKSDYCVNRIRDKSPISSLVTSKEVFEEFEKMDRKDFV